MLHESAYAFELRGAGRAQARENLKKLRGLIRRLQNRGYATLGRVAERVSQLMAGDESNAIVDALDAVNLMTVHAAKGLEFPVVFVVNLSRGTGGRGDPVEVVARVDADGEPDDLVSIDGLVDDARAEIEAREREENKRLVYVALTRARDRLYLATTLTRHGVFAPAPTALGQVLPPSFHAVFAAARDRRRRHGRMDGSLGRDPCVPARPARGRRRRRCRRRRRSVASDDDFAPLELRRPHRDRNVSELARAAGAPATRRDGARERVAARAIGSLVHRAAAAGALSASAERSGPPWWPRWGPADADGVRQAALDALDRLASRPDVQVLFSAPGVQHEVALSWPAPDGATSRAVVDAVVRRADGSVTLVEFKTGAPRDADERQLQAYVEGVRRLLPETPVDGRIIRLDS